MVHLRKEHFLVGTYNKLKMKKCGSCKIVKRHDSRYAYEVELLVELNISLVSDLIEFYEGGDNDEVADIQWSIPATTSDTKKIEEILDSHIGRRKRNKTYEEYLVKWKERLVEDSSWLARKEVDHLGFHLNT